MPGPPILLAKWYDYAKWIIERVDSFPKNQRFIFGQRLAGHVDVAQASGLPYRSASSLPPGSQPERRDPLSGARGKRDACDTAGGDACATGGRSILHGQRPDALHRAAV
jgi:hypothetical protein